LIAHFRFFAAFRRSARGAAWRLFRAAPVLALAACSTPDIDQVFYPEACREDAARHVAGIDWSAARIVAIRIRQGEYDPIIIRLLQDQAYIFRIVNRDDEVHQFRADEFFTAIAVDRVTVDGVDIGE
jgi:hypothetical protein